MCNILDILTTMNLVSLLYDIVLAGIDQNLDTWIGSEDAASFDHSACQAS
jgi:hypothetical protein